MIGEKNLTIIIREEIRRALEGNDLKGRGGNTLITSSGDIDIVTKGSHVARYNGVVLGTGSGGTIDGSGTANKIMKFIDSNTAGDSNIQDTGTNVTITLGASGTLTITRTA